MTSKLNHLELLKVTEYYVGEIILMPPVDESPQLHHQSPVLVNSGDYVVITPAAASSNLFQQNTF